MAPLYREGITTMPVHSVSTGTAFVQEPLLAGFFHGAVKISPF